MSWWVIADHSSGPGRTSYLLCVCVSARRTITFVVYDLWPGYLTRWFPWHYVKFEIEIVGQRWRSPEEHVANVVGATSSESFLISILFGKRLFKTCVLKLPVGLSYGMEPTIGGCIIMVALWNRAQPLYFHSVISFYLLAIFFLSSPNPSSRALDVYHTSTHGVALVRI